MTTLEIKTYITDHHRFMSARTMADNCNCTVDNIRQHCRRMKIQPLRLSSPGRPEKPVHELSKPYMRRKLGLTKTIKVKTFVNF